MKKKIIALIVMMLLILTNMSNVFAVEMLDLEIYETAYRLSKENDINLPFLNFFEKGAVYDKNVKHSGATFAEDTLEINEKMEGVQLIFSEDMITISGEIEHGLIYGKNIVIEGKISDDTVIIGNKVQILETAIIEKDLVIVADELKLQGTAKGNIIGFIGNIVISGTIEKDLRVSTSTIDLENSNILGTIEIDLPEGVDFSKIKDKYQEANIQIIAEEKMTAKDYLKIVIKGLKHVIVYTFIALLLMRNKNKITEKAAARFIENSTFGVLLSTGTLILSVFVVIGLITAGIFGLGVIAWPALIIFLAILLLTISLSELIVGTFLYEVIRKKASKYKILMVAGIFTVIFALTQVPTLDTYVIMALNIVALGVVMTYIFKKKETYEFTNSSEKTIKLEKEEVQTKEQKENTVQNKTEEIKTEVKENKTKKKNNNKK